MKKLQLIPVESKLRRMLEEGLLGQEEIFFNVKGRIKGSLSIEISEKLKCLIELQLKEKFKKNKTAISYEKFYDKMWEMKIDACGLEAQLFEALINSACDTLSKEKRDVIAEGKKVIQEAIKEIIGEVRTDKKCFFEITFKHAKQVDNYRITIWFSSTGMRIIFDNKNPQLLIEEIKKILPRVLETLK